MQARKVGALLLALMLTACASTPRPLPQETDPYERELEAARYALRVLTPDTGGDEPMEVRRGQVVRLTPLEEDSPLTAETAGQLTRNYLNLCQQQFGAGDCLGLLKDKSFLQREASKLLASTLTLALLAWLPVATL